MEASPSDERLETNSAGQIGVIAGNARFDLTCIEDFHNGSHAAAVRI
jgi:hypothetical protein